MGVYIPCTRCNGTGSTEITGVYAETLALLICNRGLNGAELATIAGCKPTAMNQRLKALEKLGVAKGQKYGREIKWFHKKR